MVYFKQSDYKLLGFRKSKVKDKMYDAIIQHKITNKSEVLSFGSLSYGNFHDKTGMNLYPNLIHSDKKRRKSYRSRHRTFLRKNYFSPSHFSFYYLW